VAYANRGRLSGNPKLTVSHLAVNSEADGTAGPELDEPL
jgi:hypothetical protein